MPFACVLGLRGGRQTDRQTEGQTETDRQTNRQTDRQTDGRTDRPRFLQSVMRRISVALKCTNAFTMAKTSRGSISNWTADAERLEPRFCRPLLHHILSLFVDAFAITSCRLASHPVTSRRHLRHHILSPGVSKKLSNGGRNIIILDMRRKINCNL